MIKKSTALQCIQGILIQYDDVLKMLKVDLSHLYFDAKECQVVPYREVLKALHWLEGLQQNVFPAIARFQAFTQEYTKHYDTWGDEFADFPECRMREKLLKSLRTELRTYSRPDFFKKGKRNGWIRAIRKKRNTKAKSCRNKSSSNN